MSRMPAVSMPKYCTFEYGYEKYETFLPVTPCTFTMNTRLFVNTTWSRMVWKHCTASSPGAKRSAISRRIWARETSFRFG